MTELGPVELEIAFLIGKTPDEIESAVSVVGWGAWRAAQIQSWSVPVACCIKCRREEVGCGGLTDRHTTHRKCWPEAFAADG